MNTETINLREERDFSGVVSTTFNFLKNEFIRLGTSYLYFCGPIVLVYSLVYSLFFSSLMGNIQQIAFTHNASNAFSFLASSGMYIILLLIVGLINFNMMFTLSFAYMKVYQTTNGEFTVAEVWEETQRNFFRVLGHQILMLLIYCVAVPIAMLCTLILFFTIIIPPLLMLGIVIVAIMFIAMLLCITVMEKANFGDALGRTFFLLKGSFWKTFLITFIMAFIIIVISYLFGLLNQLFTGAQMVSTLMQGKSHFSILQGIVFFIVTIITTFLPIVGNQAIAIQYFSSVQKRESPDLLVRINEIQ